LNRYGFSRVLLDDYLLIDNYRLISEDNMDSVNQGKGLRRVSIVLYIIGIIAALALALIAVVSDFEAAWFDNEMVKLAEGNGTNIACPIIVTRFDSGRVQTKVKNPNDRDRNFLVRTHISSGFFTLMREDEREFDLKAGEAETLHWLVTTEDAAWNRIILARVYVARAFGLPAATASCGIMSLNIPFPSGSMIVALLLIVGLGGMASGVFLWTRQRPFTDAVQSTTNLMLILGGALTVALIFGLLGWWLPGIGALLVTVIVALGLFGSTATVRRNL
jgi:hypothetical protein